MTFNTSSQKTQHLFCSFDEQSAVADLYSFRDLYFENHPVSEAALKAERLESKLGECQKIIDDKVRLNERVDPLKSTRVNS